MSSSSLFWSERQSRITGVAVTGMSPEPCGEGHSPEPFSLQHLNAGEQRGSKDAGEFLSLILWPQGVSA